MPSMKLHTESVGGNLHQAATWINQQGWAEYVLHMKSTGSMTVVVYKMPTELVHDIRAKSASYVPEPNHDDCLLP